MADQHRQRQHLFGYSRRNLGRLLDSNNNTRRQRDPVSCRCRGRGQQCHQLSGYADRICSASRSRHQCASCKPDHHRRTRRRLLGDSEPARRSATSGSAAPMAAAALPNVPAATGATVESVGGTAKQQWPPISGPRQQHHRQHHQQSCNADRQRRAGSACIHHSAGRASASPQAKAPSSPWPSPVRLRRRCSGS